MPVSYQPYKSMFVDFKSPEISAMLNERYLKNYTAQTQLQDQLATLKAAPFEGDRKARAELIQKTQDQLNQIAQRGDYQNLTLPIMQVAQTYTKRAAPIMQNAVAFQEFKDKLKEDYTEERLDYEDYMGTIALANSRYSGLTFDSEGNATNIFNPDNPMYSPVYNPNIQERMDDALSGIVAEEYGQGARFVGMDSASGKIQVMVEGEIKTVTNDRVQSVMDMVMSDPQVKAYLDRKGTIQTLNMSSDQLMKMKISRMGQLQNSVVKIQDAISKSKDPDEKAQLEGILSNLITNAGVLESLQTPEQLRAWASTERAREIESVYRNAATSRYAFRSETKDVQIAPKWMQTVAGNGGLGASSIYSAVPGAITQVSNPDGSTVDAITGSIANYANTLAQLEDPEYMKEQYSIPLAGSEILNMSTQQFVERFPTVDVALFNKAKSAITTATAMKIASERRMNEVRTTLGLENETFVENAKQSVRGAATAIASIASEFNVPETQAIDMLLAYVNAKQGQRAQAIPGAARSQSTLDAASISRFERLFGASNEMFSSTNGTVDGRNINAIANEISNMRRADIAVIDEYLEDNSTTTTSMPVMTTIPFYMSEAERKNLNGFLGAGNAAVASNAYLDATGNMVSFDLAVESVIPLQPNSEGFDTSTAKLKSSAFAPYNLSGTGGTMQMTYEDENGKTVVVAMPFSAIDNPGINRYEASEYAKFAAIVGSQRAKQVKNIVVPAYGADGTRFEIRVNIKEGGGADTATIVDANGNEIKTYDFDTMLKPGGPLDALTKNGGRIDYI